MATFADSPKVRYKQTSKPPTGNTPWYSNLNQPVTYKPPTQGPLGTPTMPANWSQQLKYNGVRPPNNAPVYGTGQGNTQMANQFGPNQLRGQVSNNYSQAQTWGGYTGNQWGAPPSQMDPRFASQQNPNVQAAQRQYYQAAMGDSVNAAAGRYTGLADRQGQYALAQAYNNRAADMRGMQAMAEARVAQAGRPAGYAAMQSMNQARINAQTRHDTAANRWNEMARVDQINQLERMRQAQVDQYWADQRQRSMQADADRKTAEAYWWMAQPYSASNPWGVQSGGYGGGYDGGGGGGGGGSYSSVPEWYMRMLSWQFGK